MKKFAEGISKDTILCDLLITPFLINDQKMEIYELHYYEFELQLSTAITNSYYIDYPLKNKLSKEIIDNIRPKIYIPINDTVAFSNAIKTYICAMENMRFQDENVFSLSCASVINYKLYFQIY